MGEAENYFKVKGTKPYYNLLRKFRFPSRIRIIGGILAASLLGGCASFLVYSFSLASLFRGAAYALLGVSVPLLLAGLIASKIIGEDALLNFRRLLALALFSSILWSLIAFLGGIIGRLSNTFRFPLHPLYLTVLLITPLRTLVISSISSQSHWRKFSASFIEPSAYIFAAHMLIGAAAAEAFKVFLSAVGLSIAHTLTIKAFMKYKGERELSISPTKLFRGFLLEWLERDNRTVERYLEELSVEDTVKLTVIKFRDKIHGRLKAAFAIANFHPGPLLSIGSSILPYRIQEAVKSKFGIPIAVPHGISGHERNLVSQTQNDKIISKILELLEERSRWGGVTEPVEAINGNATSKCQVFDGCALVTLTLAPKDVEDIPPEFEERISTYSKKYFEHTAIIDAHNSISKVTILDGEDIEDLRKAAEQAIAHAAEKEETMFRLGVADVNLEGYGLKHGIGPGTGYIFLVEIHDRIYSYLVLDGNNMAKGLRGEIHRALELEGITPVETMTTDTHAVNGVVAAPLGYFPIGEAIPRKDLIRSIIDAAIKARSSMIEAETAYGKGEVKVKTLGLALFSKLASFMYSMSRFIAASMIPLIASSIGILLLIVTR